MRLGDDSKIFIKSRLQRIAKEVRKTNSVRINANESMKKEKNIYIYGC